MKPTDSELAAMLRREAADDVVRAPETFDFAVMRAVRDTAPVFPSRVRNRDTLSAFTASVAACLIALAVFRAGFPALPPGAGADPSRVLAEVAESASRLAREIPGFRAPGTPRLDA